VPSRVVTGAMARTTTLVRFSTASDTRFMSCTPGWIGKLSPSPNHSISLIYLCCQSCVLGWSVQALVRKFGTTIRLTTRRATNFLNIVHRVGSSGILKKSNEWPQDDVYNTTQITTIYTYGSVQPSCCKNGLLL